MTSRIVRTDGVHIAVYESGPVSRPTVIFVHGYPDSHLVWDRVIGELVNDFHCVAYDVRGAGASDAPTSVDGYRLEQLATDLANVVDAVSPNAPVHVVGHDWGSIQTWESVTTDRLRGRIASFTSISGPCLDHMGHVLRDRLRTRTRESLGQLLSQVARSWYIWLFELPMLGERAWTHGGLAERFPTMIRKLEGVVAEPSPTRKRDGERGIGLYRANVIDRLRNPRERRAHAPVQLIVATQDRYVEAGSFADVPRWVPDLERHDIEAGHWVVLKEPSRVAGLVRDFVTRIEARSATRAVEA
jgi:pimeloyl-ACP methyl ester carboxylesterase